MIGDNEVILQVMNVSPTPTTLYKGMKLALAMPEQSVLLVSQNTSPIHRNDALTDSLDLSHLTTNEQSELVQLLRDFGDLFSSSGGPVGQTSVVKRSIPTMGGPFASLSAEYLKL